MKGQITENMFCAGHQGGGHDACQAGRFKEIFLLFKCSLVIDQQVYLNVKEKYYWKKKHTEKKYRRIESISITIYVEYQKVACNWKVEWDIQRDLTRASPLKISLPALEYDTFVSLVQFIDNIWYR